MRLSISIVLLAFIVACNNSTGVDPEKPFEPYMVGNFLLTTPYSAELQGDGLSDHFKNKKEIASSDTVKVTSLDQKGLTVKIDTVGAFDTIYNAAIEFVDSTTTEMIANFEYTQMEVNEVSGFERKGMSYSHGPYFTETQFNYQYACGTQLSDPYEAKITYFDDDSTHLKTYILKFSGLNEVLETINNCN